MRSSLIGTLVLIICCVSSLLCSFEIVEAQPTVSAGEGVRDCAGELSGQHIQDSQNNCCLPSEIGTCGNCFDSTSCLDCKNIPNGPNVDDGFSGCCLPSEIGACGACFSGSEGACGCEDGQPKNFGCQDCSGEPYGLQEPDSESGCCLPEEVGACGLCGEDSSCNDCNGVPDGPSVTDQYGACCLPEEIGACGGCFSGDTEGACGCEDGQPVEDGCEEPEECAHRVDLAYWNVPSDDLEGGVFENSNLSCLTKYLDIGLDLLIEEVIFEALTEELERDEYAGETLTDMQKAELREQAREKLQFLLDNPIKKKKGDDNYDLSAVEKVNIDGVSDTVLDYINSRLVEAVDQGIDDRIQFAIADEASEYGYGDRFDNIIMPGVRFGRPPSWYRHYKIIYFNPDDCSILPADHSLEVCAEQSEIGAYSSPIALILEPGYDIDLDVKVTQFPINPWETDSWSLWKASEQAPLLVYDPEHTGQITSGFQLFGNWTFGNKSASLRSQASHPATEKKELWSNGYEALATLDADADGRVSGSELEPLGLWFDKNRNGVSEPGEVVPLRDADVSALFYRPDSKNPVTGDINASIGFERILNGRVVTGRSVDWFTDSSKSIGELLTVSKARRLNAGGLQSKRTASVASDKPPHSPLRLTTVPKVEGVWSWSGQAKNERVEGFLLLQQRGNEIAGSAVVELRFSGPSSARAMKFSKITGTVTAVGDQPMLRFQVEDGNGAITNSAARLIDGRLIGASATLIPVAGNSGSKTSYKWTARRAHSFQSRQLAKQ